MTEVEESLKLEDNFSSPSPSQSNDSNFDSGNDYPSSSPPPDSNSNSSPPSPSPDKSPTSSSPPPPPPSNKSRVRGVTSPSPAESPFESPPSASSSSSSDSPPSSPPPPSPQQQSPPPPSPPAEVTPTPSPPLPPNQQSLPPPPPPPFNSSSEGSQQSPPPPSSKPTPSPPISSETTKSPAISPPSTNTSTKSSPRSSNPALAPNAPSTNQSSSNSPSPSIGGSENETKSQYEVIIDAAGAGAFFAVVFIVLFFIVKRRRDKKQQALPGNYTPPPENIEVKSGKDEPVLEWPQRVKIAVGAAKGVAYLHEDCQPRIIHRDIKSANILLEDDFEAQVADFGLARLNDTSQTHVSTRVMGTFGYLAPEYASSGKLTDRSDVFSYGVVLLELITGRKSVDPTQPLGDESLVEWARPRLIQALESGDCSELIDPRLEKNYVESEVLMMIEAAAACVRHSAAKRPRMALVVRALDFDGSDLSNGVKVGESATFDSSKYSDEISLFRKMAFGIDTGSECDIYSEDFSYRGMSHGHASWKSEYSSSEFTSGESEIQPFNKSGTYSDGGASGSYGSGRFK
ncbi:hypothetical protein GQ457_06G001330 [Hibiscus cannabinus]